MEIRGLLNVCLDYLLCHRPGLTILVTHMYGIHQEDSITNKGITAHGQQSQQKCQLALDGLA